MIELSLAFHRRARVWLDRLPDLCYKPEEVIEDFVPASSASHFRHVSGAAELAAPQGARCLYGLLGAEYTPLVGKQFVVQVSILSSGCRYQDALVGQIDEVRVGLPRQYARAVVSGIKELCSDGHEVPCGRLLFCCAAHALIGSNQAIFADLAKVIVRLLGGSFDEKSHQWATEIFEEL